MDVIYGIIFFIIWIVSFSNLSNWKIIFSPKLNGINLNEESLSYGEYVSVTDCT